MQTSDDWCMTIVSDGPEKDTLQRLIERSRRGELERVRYYSLSQRYNDWGHTPREFGMLQSESKYTIMSGFDNYYVPTFIETFKRYALAYKQPEMIFCNFILSHQRDGVPYTLIESEPKVGYIDIGSFATKTQTLKRLGFKSRAYAADGELAVRILKYVKDNEINSGCVKINQTLYVHN